MRGLGISDIIPWIFNAIIIVFLFYMLILFYDIQVSQNIDPYYYYMFISSIYLDRLHYCMYLTTNDSIYLHYLPSKANFSYFDINKMYLCYSVIRGKFSNVSSMEVIYDQNKKPIGVKGYRMNYEFANYPFFVFISLNNTGESDKNITFFSEDYIKKILNDELKYLFEDFAKRMNPLDIIGKITEGFNNYLKILEDIGKIIEIIKKMEKSANELISCANQDKSGIYIYPLYSRPLLEVDLDGNLYIAAPYTFGMIVAKNESFEIKK